MSARLARHVFASGRVQGVAYRWSTREAARRLGVTGWVRNLADGRVEAFVQAEAETLERMLDWLRQGPPGARVDDLAVSEQPPGEQTDFEIRETSRG